MIVGRDEELAALDALLAGAPALVLLEGAPGTGKTALLEAFLARHPGARVLRASGEPAERGVDGGVLDQLLRRAGASDLPALLSEPAIVVLDDAQWADEPSLDALVYAARRLGPAPVLVLVASRPAATLAGLRRAAARRIELCPLGHEHLHTLADALSEDASRRLWAHTGGDLTLALALLDELPASAWGDVERTLPAPRDLLADVAHRLEHVSAPARHLVEAAAVLGSGACLADAASIAAAAEGRAGDTAVTATPTATPVSDADALAALEEAAAAGLVVATRARSLPVIEFAPPAIAAAVDAQLGPARRGALHRAAAVVVEDEVVALHHLAAACAGPDGALAERLDALARRTRERPEAAAALVAAARLSPTRAQREDRLVRAVDWMLLAGDVRQARGFAAEVAGCAQSARRDSVLGQLAVGGDRVREASVWLRSAWGRCDRAADPELAAIIAHRNAFHALIHLRDTDVAEWARRALELAPDDPLAVEWNATLALSLWRQGQRAQAHDLLLQARSGDPERDAQLNGMHAWLLIVGDETSARTRDLLAAAAETELRLGAREIGVVHLNVLARAHFEVGAWDEAARVAARAVALGSRLEDVSARMFAWWAALLVPTARGDRAAARALAEHAAQEPTDAPDRVVAVGIARAIHASDPNDVIEALAPVSAIDPSEAVDEPGFWPWQHLYGDALVATRRLEQADAFLAPHEALAQQRAHGTATARLAVVRGRLEAARGESAKAHAAFAHALAALEPLERPYERALAQLALGRFLRRERRRREAAAVLTEAAERFTALGAQPALEHAHRELVASGLRPARRGGADDDARLTPQELTVARLVAGGHSNRAVADDLQLSVKTVEVHLTRIYAKLGIRSRGQLAHSLAVVEDP